MIKDKNKKYPGVIQQHIRLYVPSSIFEQLKLIEKK